MSGPPSKDTVTATAYLVVKGERRRNWSDGTYSVSRAKAVKVRQSKPDKLDADEIIVKIKVELPKRAFEPLEPEALIVVPEELVQHVVEVEAQG